MKPFHRLFELVEDWGYLTERDGLRAALPLIASELARLPYRHIRFVIVACSLLDPFPDWPPKIQLTTRPFEPADLDLVRQMDRPSEAQLCAHRLAQGDRGLLAFCNGRPAGYTWGSVDPQTRLERVHPKLCPGDVLCTDAYTCPAFRGQGIQTALTLARFRMFRDLGYGRAISYIDVHNGPSLAVWQRKFSGHIIGTMDFVRIGSRYRVRYG